MDDLATFFSPYFSRWRVCMRRKTPYGDEDLRSVGLHQYVCRWHYARLWEKRKPA